jgi:hypothetical protein
MSRLSDRHRINPNAPLVLTIPARVREHDASLALAAVAPDTDMPETGKNERGARAGSEVSRPAAAPDVSPAPGGSAACGDDDRMSSRAATQ